MLSKDFIDYITSFYIEKLNKNKNNEIESRIEKLLEKLDKEAEEKGFVDFRKYTGEVNIKIPDEWKKKE